MNLMTTLKEEIKRHSQNIELRENEPMKKHTTFRIGGPIALMALPQNKEELMVCVKQAYKLGISPIYMGKGSNLLVTDARINRFAIRYMGGVHSMRQVGDYIIAESGVSLTQLANFALEHNLTGLEFAHGIPGNLGGAVYMNAGAYDGEMSDVVDEVLCLTKEGEEMTFSNGDAKFSYRHSVFQDGQYYVLETKMKLKTGNREEIAAKMADFKKRRQDKQPLEYPNAGSVFKRPPGNFAGALIEQAGLKGKSVGGAQVSKKHAGFIVNTGNATCKDVLELIKVVQNSVYEMAGVRLETEQEYIGE